MLDRLLGLYGPLVERTLVVAHPSFADAVRRHVAEHAAAVDVALQASPTGMLDAVLEGLAWAEASAAGSIWITWCDQIGVRPDTVAELRRRADATPPPAIVLPTVRRREPYTHLVRDARGEIVELRHRREGDAMPEIGESEMGLFALSRAAFVSLLPEYARGAGAGAATRERNFLPFIPWAASRGRVETFDAVEEMEAVGVNTPDELAAMEAYLRRRERSATP
jgi:bifunctional N-acetylglucosamine-1-phosphate-uridyltransferase/glucosamine-1-phosphate-acetyltransferase GlmU-like protein